MNKTQVTIFRNIRDTSTPFFRDLDSILERIKEGKSKDLIKQIRSEKDKEIRQEVKKNLPAICFSGTFNKRNDESLIEHSGFICLDFDGYKKKKDMLSEKEKLCKDKYVYSVFISPSGNGLKAIIKIPKEPKNHKSYFTALEKHYDSEYFDKTSKNISRVCYESYDPLIFVNLNSHIWDTVDDPEYKVIEKNTSRPTIPITNENKIVDILMKWWTKKYGMVDGERNNNVYILAAAFNDYGIKKSFAEYVMGQFQSKDFSLNEITTTIDSAYRQVQNHGSKYYEDEDKINQIRTKLKRGVSKKEIRLQLADHNLEDDVIESVITTIEESDSDKIFWTKSEKGVITIVHYLFRKFLEDNGFFKFSPEGSKNFIFVKVTNNLIDDTSPEEIKDFILSHLEKLDDMSIYNYFADKTRFFRDEFLSLLGTVDVYFIEDDKDTAYLYYNNCAVKVTKNEKVAIDYIDLGGYVWRDQVIDRDFDLCQSFDCDYKTFISNVSGDDKQTIKSMRSTIGFMMHAYKNLSYCPAVILNDEVISDNPEGGTGKGLFINALSQMKKLVVIDGKAFNFDKAFPYQTVGADTQILCFDDVKKHFDFERLFSVVTEGLTLEKKNKDAIKIPFKKSPKVAITTNYAIKGRGNSFERRKWELEFKQFYTKDFTPLVEFGRILFAEWNQDEWCAFDNYMVENLMFYLTNGLIKADFKNLNVRKLGADTSHEFIEWCGLIGPENPNDLIRFNEKVYKNELYIEFIQDNPDFAPKAKRTISRTEFYRWLVSYALFKTGITPKEDRDLNGRWIMFLTNKEEV
jgi:hypothetical protein|tara:strand:+ start:4370 stop:6769 length:2400 start_codon:yes stop_codon:yes gene_type:complete